MVSIFETVFPDTNFDIANVLAICIEMQWQRKKVVLSDRVRLIISSIPTVIATLIIIIMVIFKCYFSGEHIALSLKKKEKKKETTTV